MAFRKTAFLRVPSRTALRFRTQRAASSPKRKLEVRPATVPRFWRLVDDGRPPPDGRTLELWSLACAALRIPFRSAGKGEAERLYVAPLYELRTRRELAEMAAEGAGVPLPFPVRDNAHGALLCLTLLLLWHGVTAGWWGGFFHSEWSALGSLDVYRVRVRGEWYRCVTALTLHGDSMHLFGNLLFGAPFLILLCRRVGLGTGLALTLAGGALGNACNALYRPLSCSSLGFSTALFAAVGSLTAVAAVESLGNRRALRRAGALLAAGAGVLALLGTEGERTDYAAHVLGLVAGVAVGGLAGLRWVRKGPASRASDIAAGCAAAAALAACWAAALTA